MHSDEFTCVTYTHQESMTFAGSFEPCFKLDAVSGLRVLFS